MGIAERSELANTAADVADVVVIAGVRIAGGEGWTFVAGALLNSSDATTFPEKAGDDVGGICRIEIPGHAAAVIREGKASVIVIGVSESGFPHLAEVAEALRRFRLLARSGERG